MSVTDTTTFRLYGAPRPPHTELVRERLLDRLEVDAALRVVRGPVGAGKTSLLAEWSRRRATPGLWLSAIPEMTRTDLWRAVARRAVRAGLEAFEAALGPAELGADDLPGRLADAFLAVPGEVVVVIDDYQDVADSAVHDDVLALLRLCPNLSVAVATSTVSRRSRRRRSGGRGACGCRSRRPPRPCRRAGTARRRAGGSTAASRTG